jgi:predicted transposase/invertase (TIGR01784 family)
MTDRFMTMAFDKPVAQHILSVIMGKNLIVKSVKSQPVEDNFFSRSCRFDVLAEDSNGKIYNIEVQNSNEGAVPRRARYNCEKLDELVIRKGMAYNDYPETYVIFITQNDVLGDGLPIYHIRRHIEENGKLFDDGQQIIYVNGENTDTSTALGQLMADMQQKDAAKISNKILADKMNILKKGRTFETMCREIEKLTADVTAEVAAKVTAEEQKKAIKKLAKVCRDFGLGPDAISQKLMSEYAISETEAKAYATEACKD